MKPINWPQATLEPNQGTRLIQASWADYDLWMNDVGQSLSLKWYDRFGTGEIERFMGWCKSWEEWYGIDGRDFEDWGFTFSIANRNPNQVESWSLIMDTGSDVMGSEYWDSEEVVSTNILWTLERYLTGSSEVGRGTDIWRNKLWESEWRITLWHMDPTFETQVRKYGEGLLG